MSRRHRVIAGAWVPAFALSLLSVMVAFGAATVLGAAPVFLVAVAATGLVAVVFPRTLLGWAQPVVLALALLAGDPDPARTALALFAVHLCHTLSAVTFTMPPRTRVVVAALRPTLRRFVALQAVAQAVALVVALVSGAFIGSSAVVAIIVAAVLAALAAVAAVVVSRSAERDVSPSRPDVRPPR